MSIIQEKLNAVDSGVYYTGYKQHFFRKIPKIRLPDLVKKLYYRIKCSKPESKDQSWILKFTKFIGATWFCI